MSDVTFGGSESLAAAPASSETSLLWPAPTEKSTISEEAEEERQPLPAELEALKLEIKSAPADESGLQLQLRGLSLAS